ncbi:MAG TPA: hypothetical protein VI362_01320, partial [Ignavibacteriaceae bacterium]|nr:hypothetical protein [Ignavibacteriaceae bacterium]
MKLLFFFRFFIPLTFFCSISLLGQTTYTWIGANNASWAVSTNWSPTRTTPAATDTLQFTDGTTKNVTSVPTETIGRLLVNTSTNITLQITTGTITLTIGNLTGDDLVIASGSSLTIGGTGTSLTVTLASSATADISGTLTVNSGRTYNTNGTSVLTTVTTSIVNSGTVTCTDVNKLSFGSGATYRHSQNGGTVPTATWNAASNCNITGMTSTYPGGMGQTFGNVTFNSALSSNTTMSSDLSCNGNLTMSNTGSNLRLTTSAARTIIVSGNFSQTSGTLDMSQSSGVCTLNITGNFSQSSGTITETGSASGNIVFNGSGLQTYTSSGSVLNTINFTLNGAGGVNLGSNMTVPGTLNLTLGTLTVGVNTLTLSGSSPTRTSGFINASNSSATIV